MAWKNTTPLKYYAVGEYGGQTKRPPLPYSYIQR